MTRALALVLLFVSSLSAAEPRVGCYAIDPEAGDDPAVTAERAVRDVPWLWRGRAKARLKDVLTPSPALEIQRDGEAYVIEGKNGRLRVVADGPDVERRSPQGEAARVTATLEEGVLVVRIAGGRGERTQVFIPTEDGLRVVVALDSDRNREPVRLTHQYRGPSPCSGSVSSPSAVTENPSDAIEEER